MREGELARNWHLKGRLLINIPSRVGKQQALENRSQGKSE